MKFFQRLRRLWALASIEPVGEPEPKKDEHPMFVSDQLLERLGSMVVLRRKMVPYTPFPGVVPDLAQVQADNAADPRGMPYLAMDDGAFAPAYAWLNNNNCGLGFPGYAYLSELSQRSEYRAPAETTAKEMTRKFIKLVTKGKGDKADKIAKLDAAFKRYDVRQIWRKVLEVDMFFGRAQIFIDIDGQDDDVARQLPLVIAPETIKKGSLKGFKVIEPIWTTPAAYNANDPTKPDFYVPYAWYVQGRRVNSTRLITVISRPVPDLLKPAYNFGGISLTQLCEPYVLRWLKTVDSVNRIVSNFSVMILKTNMQTILAGNSTDSKGVVNRAKLFTLTRDNQALTMLDKDTEEMDQIAVPLSGLSELQAQAQEHMAAPSHIPLVKLTGITPSGLNASSEGEITVYHEFVGSEQENVIEPGLDLMLDLIQLSEFGEVDEDIDYEFVPLVESTLKEHADIRKADGDLAVALLQNNVVSPDEVRENLMSNPDSGYTNLTGPAPEPPEPEMGEEGDEGGGSPFGD